MARRADLQLNGFQPWGPQLKNGAVPAFVVGVLQCCGTLPCHGRVKVIISARRAMVFAVRDVIPFLTERRGESVYLFPT